MPPPLYCDLDSGRSEIRVLNIQPAAAFDDPIRCSLQTISLNDSDQQRPQYEALSYVWGNSAEKRTVWVDDHHLEITVSLETALRRLRQTNETRTIWADALCINQDDVAEKNVQVPLMGKIYHSSSRVVIWLGEQVPPGVRLGFRWLAKYDQKKKEIQERGYIDEREQIVAQQAFWGLRQVLHHTYWSRMWTFQEYLLAPRRQGGRLLIWGAHECADPIQIAKAHTAAIVLSNYASRTEGKALLVGSFGQLTLEDNEDFELAELADNSDLNDGTTTASAATGIEAEELILGRVGKNHLAQRRLRSNRDLLAQLIWDTAAGSCSDPRDKVYALYGLLNAGTDERGENKDSSLPAIDYNTSERQLFWKAVAFTLPGEKGYYTLGQYLSHFHLYEDRLQVSTTPSWVPNLTSKMDAGPRAVRGVKSPDHHRPGRGLRLEAIKNPDGGSRASRVMHGGRMLRVWGKLLGPCSVVGRIAAAAETVDFGGKGRGEVTKIARAVLGLLDSLAGDADDDGGRLMRRRLSRALVAHSYDENRFSEEAMMEMVTEYVAAADGQMGKDDLDEMAINVWHDVLDGLGGKTVLNTAFPPLPLADDAAAQGNSGAGEITQRLFGVSVAAVQDGDVAVLAPEFGAPVILRPEPESGSTSESQEQRYRLVGIAYIEGAMWGNHPDDEGLVKEMQQLRWQNLDII